MRAAGSARSSRRTASTTGAQREVLTVIARGRSNAEIAETLYVGAATVKTHVARMLAKLGVRDRIQAIVLAYETGFVQPGDAPRDRLDG